MHPYFISSASLNSLSWTTLPRNDLSWTLHREIVIGSIHSVTVSLVTADIETPVSGINGTTQQTLSGGMVRFTDLTPFILGGVFKLKFVLADDTLLLEVSTVWCCSVFWCVVVCCSDLSVSCSMLQCVAVEWRVLKFVLVDDTLLLEVSTVWCCSVS